MTTQTNDTAVASNKISETGSAVTEADTQNNAFIQRVNLQDALDAILRKGGREPQTLYRGYQIKDNKDSSGNDVKETWKYFPEITAATDLGRKQAMFADVCASTYRTDFEVAQKEEALWISDAIHFDFDGDSIAEVIPQTRKFINKLANLGIDPQCLRIFASGGKGFHIFLPVETFKQNGASDFSIEELQNLPAIMKAVAWELVVDTLDLRVYTRGRMFRRENIQRSNTKYKVAISHGELMAMDQTLYEQLVSQPRSQPMQHIAPVYSEQMEALWYKCKVGVCESKKKRKQKSTTKQEQSPQHTERMSSVLNAYGPDDYGYDGWCNGVMAIHAEFEGSAQGFEMARSWSERSQYFDLDELETTWDALTVIPDGITIGTLIYKLHDAGVVWIDPHPELNPRNQIDSPSYVMRETDEGFAEHLATKFSDELRFVGELGAWAYFDGRSWVIESGISAPKMRAKAEIRAYQQKVSAIQPQGDAEEERRKKSLAFAFGYENGRKLENVVSKMQSEPELITGVSLFDDRPYLINLINGTYDLKKDELRPHDPLDYLTQRMHVEFDPAVTCPRWEQFVDEITCGNKELAKYLQCIAGLCLSGDISQHEAYFLWGNGSNGKSVFTGMIRRLCADYFKPLNVDVLMHNNKSGQISTGLASLRGARVVATSELPRGVQLKSNVYKDLTGGDALQVDDKYVKAFTLKPQCTILVPTNFLPTITENDNGTWRRCVIIPFNATFDGKSKDANLSEKLERELPGILNWAIEGFRRFLAGEMIIPICVKELTAKYRDDLNLTAKFVNQYLVKDSPENPGGRIKLDDLYAMYQVFCKAEGMRGCITKRMFKEDIQAYIPDFSLVARTPIYRGWRIISEHVPEDFMLTRFNAEKYKQQAITYLDSEILT